MRYFLAAILFCAVGMDAASALPIMSRNALSMSKPDSMAQVVKHTKKSAHRHSRAGNGGVHPLVGSGDY